RDLGTALAAVERELAAADLHNLVERLRAAYGADAIAGPEARAVAEQCRRLWAGRGLIAARLGPGWARGAREDLLDLAILWADLQGRTGGGPQGRRAALAVLAEAERLCGPAAALARERAAHAAALGLAAPPAPPPETAWDHFTLGRSLFL